MEDISRGCMEIVRHLKLQHPNYVSNSICARLLVMDTPIRRAYRIYNIEKEKFDVITVSLAACQIIINPTIDDED